jgi:hypothetical protein
MRRRLPSPSTVIAFLALVAALGGTAVALPGKSRVKADDIAKNAVTGKKVKNNSLTGADVREARLGKVPSAGTADFAGASGAVVGLNHFGPITMVEGEVRTLFSEGPLSAVAQCRDDAATTALDVFAATSVADSAFAGDDNRGYFGPDTPTFERTFERPGATDSAGGPPSVSDGFDDQFWITAPGGPTVYGMVGSTANADSNSCVVFGYSFAR